MADSRTQFNPILLSRAIQAFNEFTQTNKSSEDYYPREKYPQLNIPELKVMLAHPDAIQIMEAYLIGEISNQIGKLALDFAEKSDIQILQINGRKRHFLAIKALSPHLIQHGECQPLTIALMLKMMKLFIPSVEEVQLFTLGKNGRRYNHSFLRVYDDQRNTYVFDPFFKIHDSENNYYTSPKFLNYFRKLTGDAQWTIASIQDDAEREYSLANYLDKISEIEDDMLFFKSKINCSQEIMVFEKVLNLKSTDPFTRLENLFTILTPILKKHCVDTNIMSKNDFDQVIIECNQFLSLKKKEILNTSDTKIQDLDGFIASIQAYNQTGGIQGFIDLVKQNNLGAALRTACTSTLYGCSLVSAMIKYPNLFPLEELILEKNKGQSTALHIAASKANAMLCHLLLSVLKNQKQGLDELDGNGKTAQQVLDEALKKAALKANMATLPSRQNQTLYAKTENAMPDNTNLDDANLKNTNSLRH